MKVDKEILDPTDYQKKKVSKLFEEIKDCIRLNVRYLGFDYKNNKESSKGTTYYYFPKELNADAPENRPVSWKTLRKTFVNWMMLAGMDQNVADAIEARDDHNVSNVSYHSTADTKGRLQYPKAVRLFLLEYPLPEWMQEYGNEKKKHVVSKDL